MPRKKKAPLVMGGAVLLVTGAAAAQKGPAAPAAPAPAPAAPAPAPASTGATGAPVRATTLAPVPPVGDGGGTYRGSSSAQGVFESYAARVPSFHVVKRGDTLFDITDHYYRNGWYWPKVWSMNPAIQNPHWIYPGDQIRLRTDGGDDRGSATLGSGIVNRRQIVPANTVFLRDQGYIDDERRDVWGVVSGSPDDQMLLAEGGIVYLEIKKDHEPKKDQDLTIFRPLRSVGGGSVVQIVGTARVLSWDADKKIARAKIIESVDVIERGLRVGPVGRKFDVVPPTRNKQDLVAHVTVSIVPLVFYGQNQIVFLDKGSDEGLAPGNRLFILRRGDPWRGALQGSGDLSDKSVRYSASLGPELESVRGTDRDRDYTDEIVGELRVLRTREKTATCLLTSSKREIVSGDVAVARKGY